MVDVNALRAAVDARLRSADAALAFEFPGHHAGRQPVHTVYVPANQFSASTAPEWGTAAAQVVASHEDVFAEMAGGAQKLERVRSKLRTEPIEDLRIDFEDGYGTPGDEVEDQDVRQAATSLAEAVRDGAAPPYFGIRMKSLEAPTRGRGLRTLVGFVESFVAATGPTDGSAEAPLDRFVVTLPKVTSVDQVATMAYLCDQLESSLTLPPHSLRFEIQVETPQSILGPDGTALVARMIHAAARRCTGLHFGTYDYTAFCGIAAGYQSMAHPAADHAKLVMQAAAAGTGVRLSDGSTNVLPVGDADAVRTGWALHMDLVRRSLERGFYQGWDLHPAQLPSRYAATFGFYLDSLEPAAERLRRYTRKQASAIADEPATARALADFLLRAVECGAASSGEVAERTGLPDPELVRLARPSR
jgi:citrate lyase beta subunit